MRGHTLVELTFVLLLLGVAVTSVAPAARKARDRAAVTGAREALVGLLAEARQAAIESGSGAVRLSEGTGVAEAFAGAEVVRWLSVSADFGAEMSLGGARTTAELRYDALGLGRVASQTVVLSRGSARAVLVVSSYGRVTRR